MSEYWTPLERLLAQDTAVLNPEVEIPRMLVAQHFVAPENEAAAREVLAQHHDTYIEDPDNEYDYYCECGKWLERDQYEMPDHQAAVLDDEGLLLPDYGPDRPLTGKPAATPVPAAFPIPPSDGRVGRIRFRDNEMDCAVNVELLLFVRGRRRIHRSAWGKPRQPHTQEKKQ